MKASNLIEHLAEQIRLEGDLEVMITRHDGDGWPYLAEIDVDTVRDRTDRDQLDKDEARKGKKVPERFIELF